MTQAGLDRPVKVPDRGEVLQPGHDVAGLGQRHRAAVRGQALGVVQRHALGALQEYEMPQRRLAEGQQRQLDPGRVMLGRLRQVRPGQVRGRPDRRQQIVHQGQVKHLLGSHVPDLLPPAGDRGQFRLGQPLVGRLLEGEYREHVLAHDRVLQLCRLAEHVDQRLPVLDDERRLGRGQPAPGSDHLSKPTTAGGGRRFAHILLPHLLPYEQRPACRLIVKLHNYT